VWGLNDELEAVSLHSSSFGVLEFNARRLRVREAYA
jgi:hypothetical protein